MSEEDPDTAAPQRGLVAAFADETRRPAQGRLAPRLWGAGFAVLLVAGVAVGFGALTKPGAQSPKSAGPIAVRTPTPPPTTAATSSAVIAPTSPVGLGGGQNQNQGGSVIVDGGGQNGTSTGTGAVAPKAVVKAPAAAFSFSAITGYGCTEPSSASFVEAGYYSDGLNGFLSQSTGGWGTQGCHGSFGSMPMSGSASSDDGANYALWTFRPGTSASLSCKVSVFTPNSHDIIHVGGNPAHYEVFDGASASGHSFASFTINQVGTVNDWVSAGPFTVSGGAFTVKLDSRGLDWSGTKVTHAHLAVAQVRVTCTN